MLKIFAQGLNEKTLQQIKETEVKYPNSKIAIMPDAHPGSGCVIGTTIVLPSVDTPIDPQTVGSDLGCGVLVAKLDKRISSFSELDKVINDYIPSGKEVNSTIKVKFDRLNELKCRDHVNVERGRLALGTLGGGNHFIELDVDSDGFQYIVIHSGSRGIGYQVAAYYTKRAKKGIHSKNMQNLIATYKKEGRQKEIELALIEYNKSHKNNGTLKDILLKEYIHDTKIMNEYAVFNRATMLYTILHKIKRTVYNTEVTGKFDTRHNYIDTETNIIRKGAVRALKGELISIPLNMRDGTLICIGKGNSDWNYSAPHGAGRLFSRMQAKANLTMNDFRQSMNGIYSSSVVEATLDESPSAYKDASEIAGLIKPTVFIIKRLKPIYSFKATE